MLTISSFMGRNNGVLEHFLWKYNCEGQKYGKYGGNMMYVYGLDHVELGEHFLVLTLPIVEVEEPEAKSPRHGNRRNNSIRP